MLDRRFLSISLVVQAIADSPAGNPVAGTQYIVGSNPTGVFTGAATNSIARYDGSQWAFIPPEAGNLEAINIDTQEILSYDGTTWVAVASFRSNEAEYIDPVNAIVATGNTLPVSANKGDLFLNTSDAKIYTAIDTNTWNSGVLTSNEERYASFTDFKIYLSNGSEVSDMRIVNGNIFYNKADKCIYIYDQEAGTYARVGGASAEVVTEFHSLSSDDVSAKSFHLHHYIASGHEANLLVFVSGIALNAGIDFTASGNTVSWENKGLDSIELHTGDRFIIHYIRR